MAQAANDITVLTNLMEARLLTGSTDLFTRMHAASVTDSLGAILVISGVMLQAGLSLATIKLAAILLFLLLTSPTSANALASAALLSGKRPLAEQADPEDAA